MRVTLIPVEVMDERLHYSSCPNSARADSPLFSLNFLALRHPLVFEVQRLPPGPR